MRKKLSKIIAMLSLAAMIISACVCAVSADSELTVNGETVAVGDTVTYEYYIGGTDDLLAAAGGIITYDSSFLEYVEGSIGFDVFNNAMYNISDGIIYYSSVNAINGYDISSERLAVSVSFKVLETASGSTEITHTFDEIFTTEDYSTDLTDDDYNDRETVTVNYYNGVNSSPYLGTDADEIQSYIEANSDITVSEILEGNVNSNAGNNSGAEIGMSSGVVITDSEGNIISSENIESADVADTADTADSADKINSQSDDSNSGSIVVAIICIVVVLAAVGICVYFFVIKKNSAKH